MSPSGRVWACDGECIIRVTDDGVSDLVNAFLVEGDGKVIRSIERRPDRNWLDVTRDASVAPDGSFAIVTGGGYWYKKSWLVSLYSAAGNPVRILSFPAACMDFCFAYTGKYLATRTENDICLFDATDEPVLKFSPAVDGFNEVRTQRWLCFATMGGTELWLVCADRKSVWRFELP